MRDGGFPRDLATIGVGVGLPATFIAGILLLFLTAFTGRVPMWVLIPFVVLALASAGSYLALRRHER